LGLLSRVDVEVVPNQKAKTLQPRIREKVAKGSRVFTDSLASYEGLGDEYAHAMVEHAKGEYVKDGDVHTNCMETSGLSSSGL
jgi:transposase-like protein